MIPSIMPFVLAALLTGCATVATPPPPSTVRSVAVLPPSNRTADGLLVTGASFLEKYAFRTDRVTVADVLGAELRTRLERRGFAVVPPDVVRVVTEGRTVGSPEAAVEIARHGHLDDPVLFVAIDRWEPDAGTHPAFVIVGIEAALVDPGTGAVLWSVHRRASPIATPGTVTLATAYEIAAAAAAEDLVTSWGAERPGSEPAQPR
jgi:hypothetical protein